MSGEAVQEITLEDHQKAFTEVAFIMDIFAATIDNIMGGATAPVGRIAGREMAKKLPLNLNSPTLEEAITVIAPRMEAGFRFSLQERVGERELLFGRCVVRDVCTILRIQLGGPLCRLFHAYFDGILNELICRPVKSELSACGEQCRTTVRVQ